MIVITSNIQDADRAIARLENMPTPEMTAKLDALFEASFAEAEARVHILSGSLKASGKESTSSGDNQWEGEMRWGGPSAPHEVDYAIYEKARHGAHDWLAEMPGYDHAYVALIREALA